MTFAELQQLQKFHHEASAHAERIKNDPVHRKLGVAKRVTWMSLLAGSFLFYYLIACLHEAVTLL